MRDSGNIGRNRRVERGSQQDVAGAYNAVFTSAKPTGRRTSMVVDPTNGRIPALTPEMQERNRLDREFRLALLQNTETCKSKAPACNGGTYGPPSPRLAETALFYNTQRMNRHNGPEDQSLGDRCMLGREPDFNGFRRIVQGPESVAIGNDTGQGQGYQRVVYLTGKHPPSAASASATATRAANTRAIRSSSRRRTSRRSGRSAAPPRTSRWSRSSRASTPRRSSTR